MPAPCSHSSVVRRSPGGTARLIWDGPDEISETIGIHPPGTNRALRREWFSLGDWLGSHRVHHGIGPGYAIGMMSTEPSVQPGRGDVGYWLGKPYWRQGDHARGTDPPCSTFVSVSSTRSRSRPRSSRQIPGSMALVEGLGMQLKGDNPLVSPKAWGLGRRTRLRDPPRRVDFALRSS